MKLMQVSLSARKDLESSLHGCGGPVMLVQAGISVRKDQFMYHERSRKQFATLWLICESRAGQYKCQERSRKQFSSLWRSCDASAPHFQCQ